MTQTLQGGHISATVTAAAAVARTDITIITITTIVPPLLLLIHVTRRRVASRDRRHVAFWAKILMNLGGGKDVAYAYLA